MAALVALASFSGSVGAAATTGSPAVETVQEEGEAEIDISDMRVENLSTSMSLESATLEVQAGEETQEITVDSASIELTDATVQVRDARLVDGQIELGSATLLVTDGTIEIESSAGDRTIDLSDATAENQTIVVEDIVGETLGISEDLSDATIRELTVDGLSGSAAVELLGANFRGTPATGDDNVSVSIQGGDVSVEGASITLTNASFEGETLTAEQVNASVESVTLEAERLVVLKGLTLTDQQDVSLTVVDASFSESDVEVEVSDLDGLLEQLLGSQAAAAATTS